MTWQVLIIVDTENLYNYALIQKYQTQIVTLTTPPIMQTTTWAIFDLAGTPADFLYVLQKKRQLISKYWLIQVNGLCNLTPQ